jgi:hypothetical protein
MKLGLHLSNFTYGVPTAELAAKLTEIVVGGEAAGFDRLSVMDHYFQIPHVGPVESEMFEARQLTARQQRRGGPRNPCRQ